ncbi:MAG: hypothetical protein AB7O69_02600 [Burkholderiales bacterium]
MPARFLDRIATHFLAFEGDAQVVFFSCNCRNTKPTRGSASAKKAPNPNACVSSR